MDRTQDRDKVTGKTPQMATEGVGSPISNEAYNIIAALHAKLEGLEAYRKYSMDAQGTFWKKMSDREQETVRLLVDELDRLCKEGKLRMGEPGKAGPKQPTVKS